MTGSLKHLTVLGWREVSIYRTRCYVCRFPFIRSNISQVHVDGKDRWIHTACLKRAVEMLNYDILDREGWDEVGPPPDARADVTGEGPGLQGGEAIIPPPTSPGL